MKYQIKIIMNKLYNNMRVFLLASCVSFFTSCDNALDRNEASNPDKVLSFMISKGNMKTSRASMNDATMRTEFEVGDKAGVFAVHDGHIVDGFNNLELTYNASGKWQPNESILYNTDMENYTFYAYYPYNTDILFNSTNENPFEDAIRNRKFISDQSSVKLFNEADLMTTSGCSLDPEFHIVNFTMTHVGRLVTIQLPNSSYIFENEDPTIEPYVLSKAENVIFSVNGSKVYPYFDEQVQAYRLILGDNQTKMVVEYINNGRFQKVEITNLPEIERGEYATYIVDGGVQSQKMFLQIGDYYLSDGNIISKDSQLTEEEKMKIIGIIYKLKTTNTIMETNPNWKHAMVIGLTEINNSQWGSSNTPSGNWYQSYGLNDLGSTNASSVELDALSATGYERTMAWESVYANLGNFPSEFHNIYTTQQNNVSTPTMSTTWFIPSIREWMDIQDSNNAVSMSIKVINSTALNYSNGNGYWSSDLRSGTSCWCYNSNKPNNLNGVGFNNRATYRWILAF